MPLATPWPLSQDRPIAPAAIGLLVMAMHMALLSALDPRPVRRFDDAAPGPAITYLRLLFDPLAERPAAAPAGQAVPPLRARHAARPATTGAATAPAVGETPMPDRSAPDTTDTAGPSAAASAPRAADAPRPLDLRLDVRQLDTWRSRNPAAQVQAGRSMPLALESRIAAALGTGTWHEQRIDADTVRLRSGGRCVTMRRPRIGQIDPMGPSGRDAPWTVSEPFDCRE